MFEQCSSHIGRYEVTGKIGSGAMGTVYKGVDPGIGRTVAIKLVRAELCHGHDYLDRFRQEMRAAGRCSHPGIVAIFDCGEWEERPYLVMEYLQGQSLQHMIAKGPLQPEEAANLVGQLLEALGVAHQQGVVHRDIKPANIIVTAEGRLKITDFGLALLDAATLPKPEALVGTPSFMAPEQARGEAVDHRADLFSAGILLYRLLIGGSPYGSDTFATILEKVAGADRIDVSAVEVISPLLASVVSLALQKDVSNRFQSASEFAHSLRSALASGVTAPDPLSANSPGGGEDTADVKPTRPPMPDDLKSRYLAEMRPMLASSLGPIANRVIAEAFKRCSSAQAMTDFLARHLTDNVDEQAFRIAAGKLMRQHEVSAPEARVSRPGLEKTPLPAKLLDAAQNLLASFVGPISGIVIRQSLFDVTNGAEFASRLATHILDEKERVVFLARLDDLMSIHGAGEGHS